MIFACLFVLLNDGKTSVECVSFKFQEKKSFEPFSDLSVALGSKQQQEKQVRQHITVNLKF